MEYISGSGEGKRKKGSRGLRETVNRPYSLRSPLDRKARRLGLVGIFAYFHKRCLKTSAQIERNFVLRKIHKASLFSILFYLAKYWISYLRFDWLLTELRLL